MILKPLSRLGRSFSDQDRRGKNTAIFWDTGLIQNWHRRSKMEIKSSELKGGRKLRKVVYINGVKHYAEIKVIKVYSYQASHSRDLRRKGSGGDR